MSRFALALLLAVPGWPTAALAANADYGSALAALQAKDARLQSVGWRLATGNARWCDSARPAVGLLLQDVTTYNRPEEVRRAAGLSGDVAVQAVAEGSPAQSAGLQANDEVLAIGGKPVNSLPSARHSGKVGAAEGLIADQLLDKGEAVLQVRGGDGVIRDIQLRGVPACPGRFEVVTGQNVAQADGERILIGERYGEARNPADSLAGDQFSVIVAHEFAHNLLGHKDRLDRIGRNTANIRKIEREADRLSVWLLVNAGIDPQAALSTTESWRRKRDAGLLRAPTHAGWRERRAIIAQEIDRMQAILVRHGAADWSRWFIREE